MLQYHQKLDRSPNGPNVRAKIGVFPVQMPAVPLGMNLKCECQAFLSSKI